MNYSPSIHPVEAESPCVHQRSSLVLTNGCLFLLFFLEALEEWVLTLSLVVPQQELLEI